MRGSLRVAKFLHEDLRNHLCVFGALGYDRHSFWVPAFTRGRRTALRERRFTTGRWVERWPSGRRQRFAKPSQGQKPCRGFKSRPLRHTTARTSLPVPSSSRIPGSFSTRKAPLPTSRARSRAALITSSQHNATASHPSLGDLHKTGLAICHKPFEIHPLPKTYGPGFREVS